ncbi:MAG TPA: hypothetical protein PKI61_04340, partial [bacterium]|nr:hypothetical protein [bacterium]
GDTAYTMMRQMGLGVSNKNLEKLKAKQADLIERLKGKIVLQVENHGEAYYIHPKTGILYYLKNGEEAYKIMRNLSLGITNQNLNNIETGNLEADNQSSEVEGNLNNSNGSITLTGANHDGTIDLNWTLANMTSPNGFKVVVATHENPVYPGDDYHYLTSPDVRSDAWSDLDSGTYYFRVCEYLGGACGVYSNNYKVTILQPVSNTDGSITLTGNVVDGKINLNWTLANMTSPNGFKVVVAGHENPIYPGDTYHYLSSPTVRSDSWSDLPAGTHNFRVCEYLGGACGVYSNNLQLNF